MTDQTTPLRDRIAAAARTIQLRLGSNAVAMAQRGEPIILNLNEADDLADAVLAAVLPATTIHDTDTGAESERREQYAAAMENARRDSSTGAVLAMARMVDAAMAVADAEINEHREHIAVYRKDSAAQYQIIAELQRENAELRRVADETAATETQATEASNCNSGPGWYEVITPRATTCIAYVHEDGSLYLPEGEPTEEEFAFAAARGRAHRLVRADEQPAAGARQDGADRG